MPAAKTLDAKIESTPEARAAVAEGVREAMVTGQRTPGINPGVRVRLIAAPGYIGTVDGWMNDVLVRVAWDGGLRSEVAAIALEVAPQGASPVTVPPAEFHRRQGLSNSHATDTPSITVERSSPQVSEGRSQ